MTSEVTRSIWEPHTHEDDEGRTLIHIHGEWTGFGFFAEVPLQIIVGENVDVAELMKLRGMAARLGHEIEFQKMESDPASKPPFVQTYSALVGWVDSSLSQGLVEVIDQALAERGIVPPCYLRPIDSSNVDAIGYVMAEEMGEDGEPSRIATEGSLYVYFTNGSLYRYDEVPMALVEEFWEAESYGRFLNARVKGTYPYQKVWEK